MKITRKDIRLVPFEALNKGCVFEYGMDKLVFIKSSDNKAYSFSINEIVGFWGGDQCTLYPNAELVLK